MIYEFKIKIKYLIVKHLTIFIQYFFQINIPNITQQTANTVNTQ